MMYLQELASQGSQEESFVLEEDLPGFMSAPCQISAKYQVENKGDFYLIHLHVKTNIMIVCQRCLKDYAYLFDNVTTIAVSNCDEKAEKLLLDYECIVSSNFRVELRDIVRDELFLYAPQIHQDVEDCDGFVNTILIGDNIPT